MIRAADRRDARPRYDNFKVSRRPAMTAAHGDSTKSRRLNELRPLPVKPTRILSHNGEIRMSGKHYIILTN